MPSGNAIYTYTGPEESTEIQGQIFLKDQPKHITDQGVIAACAAREDFEAADIGEIKDLKPSEVAVRFEVFDELRREVERVTGIADTQRPANPLQNNPNSGLIN